MGELRSGTGDYSIYQLRVKRGDETDPRFEKLVKNGKEWEPVDEVPGISGYITEAKIEQYTYKSGGQERDGENLILLMQDEQGRYMLKIPTKSAIGRNVLNTMSWIGKEKKHFGEFMIRVYEKNGYANVYIENDGEKCEWALSWDQQKELIDDIPTDDGVVKSYKKLLQKLKTGFAKYVVPAVNESKEMAPEPEVKASRPAPAEESKKTAISANNDFDEEPEDDLPF